MIEAAQSGKSRGISSMRAPVGPPLAR